MYKNKKISLIIPCHNEERGLSKILIEVPKFIDEVIVVDNDSTDKTAVVAKNFGAKVVFEKKKGYGNAYLAGFKHSAGDIIVTMDGDNSYPVGEIVGLLNILVNKNLDFISGCRFPLQRERSMNYINKLGNFVLTLFFKILVFENVKDSQSGMWVFKREVLLKMNLKSNGMSFSEEIKMEAILNKKINFREVNISYKERIGQVKLKMWQDGFLNLIFLFKKRLEIFLKI